MDIIRKSKLKTARGGAKTVYGRLLFAFIFIITVAVLVLGMMLSSMIYNQYAHDLQVNSLRGVEAIQSVMQNWGNQEKDTQKYDSIRERIRNIAGQYNAHVWVVDRSGEKMFVGSPYIYWPLDNEKVDQKSFKEAFDLISIGQTIEQTNMFNSEQKHSVFTVGAPLIIEDRIEGAVFLHRKTEDVRASTSQLYQSLIVPCSIAVFLTVVLISIILHRFTRPLGEMNRIASSYAKGDFSKRVVVTSNDEIGQLSKSFNAMAQDLQGLEEMRRSFVANVSHELKSPLASMWGFLQAILDGSIPETQQKEYLQIVLDETKRLSSLINDLLDLSKIESGKVPLHLTSFDINELIARTIITFENRIDNKQIDIDLAFGQEHIYANADVDRITQVLRNLIDNALKFSREKGKLTIKTEALPKQNLVSVSIKDSGVGVSQEDLAHIWERFFKVEKAHTPGEEGTGLGLSIVKRIIEQHGTDITAQSELGAGMTFRFTLPMSNEETRQ